MTLFNPYLLADSDDSNVRPYLGGFREKAESIATIVLYTGKPTTWKARDLEKASVDFTGKKNKVPVKAIRTDVRTNDQAQSAIQSNNAQIPTLNNNDNGLYIGVFNNFSLMQVMEAKDQIVKLHQNFGDSWNLFFFGDSPNVYTFRGMFLDTIDYPYYQEFMTMYDRYLAGKKCVENGFKMKLSYDGKVIGGYLLNIQTIIANDTPHTKTFSFTVVITDENFMRENSVVRNGEFVGVGFNQLNNSHRVIDQYPGLIQQVTGEETP